MKGLLDEQFQKAALRAPQSTGINAMKSTDTVIKKENGIQRRPRAKLSKTQVLQIFQLKGLKGSGEGSDRVTTHRLARKLGVSEKTIRNIWSGQTWKVQTAGLSVEVKTGNYTPENSNYLSSPTSPDPEPDNRFPPWRDCPVACGHSTSSDDYEFRRELSLQLGKAISSQARPLPESSNPDDPFHDDWPFLWG
eukprot:CAMPEP_0113689694 /NCGR_PEP_ID=MMETSP0038_2-20120614/17332_1 /TAXON_ID=2898 /ORGANISM="Cryptomonas paramecium" /LENGTH=192 /DNA_ID=CAMNT_0000610845 /DNA_START=29 /DNA_END=607 /DNA_ORIENTATION=+ /assembly_acc=CAM_ASM_000170